MKREGPMSKAKRTNFTPKITPQFKKNTNAEEKGRNMKREGPMSKAKRMCPRPKGRKRHPPKSKTKA
jgi:hypothetical protein